MGRKSKRVFQISTANKITLSNVEYKFKKKELGILIYDHVLRLSNSISAFKYNTTIIHYPVRELKGRWTNF